MTVAAARAAPSAAFCTRRLLSCSKPPSRVMATIPRRSVMVTATKAATVPRRFSFAAECVRYNIVSPRFEKAVLGPNNSIPNGDLRRTGQINGPNHEDFGHPLVRNRHGHVVAFDFLQ